MSAKIAAKLTAKEKSKIRNAATCDVVSFKKDGLVEFKQSFFYRHGGSEEKFAARIKLNLMEAGFKVKIQSKEEQWKAWPKTSYWVVVAQVTGVETA